MYGNLCQPTRKGSAEWIENGSVVKKNECGQKKMSVLSVSVSVECGVLSMTVPYLGNPLYRSQARIKFQGQNFERWSRQLSQSGFGLSGL